ncbi:MAG: helix-turn-helix domain-containing protein [Bacteroidetes bacterium]|nr:helix-turn-helix domain-containing protein [Bacteroidota bacterium]
MNNPFDELSMRLERIEQLLVKNQPPQTQEQKEDPLLNIEEAAAYLKIPKKTIYQYTSNRKLIPLKPGRRLLFRKSDLDNFLTRK